MEQNENQYEEPDRRKIAFLIGGLLVILAALLLVIYLFTDRTNASTGEGDAIRITPERIERISDDVSQRVLDTLSTDLLTDRIRDAVTKELSKDKIYEILSGSDIEVAAIGEEELKDIITVILTDLGISTDRTFTEEQKKYIRLAVDDALAEALANRRTAAQRIIRHAENPDPKQYLPAVRPGPGTSKTIPSNRTSGHWRR